VIAGAGRESGASLGKDGRRQKAEGRRQKAEGRRQKAEGRRPEAGFVDEKVEEGIISRRDCPS
jgi:hypothetical protein